MPNYLNYDAESILTKLKLNIQSSEKYSDQLFDGSNLSILLETLSLMFENMTYIVNNEATQASFGDTTIYEAINKLVKKLAYNPRGPISAATSTTTFGIKDDAPAITGASTSTKIFSKFIRFVPPIGKRFDSDGNPIYYSLVEDYTLVYSGDNLNFTSTDSVLFYNGEWKKYATEFTTSGSANDTFEIELNQEDNPVSDLKMFAYLKDGGTWYEYRAVRNIFDYNADDDVFEVRVNEDKELTIRFGDGVSGSIPPANKNLIIFYLRSNGNEGVIGKEFINVPQQSDISFGVDNVNEADLLEMLGIDETDKTYIINEDAFGDDSARYIYATVDTASTSFEVMETVDEIKVNAPTYFRSGGQLLTKNDFENYITTYYSDAVHDSEVMNNWDYMARFHKWLYDYGFLNPQIASSGYTYADSCDFNNIYVWLQANSSTGNVSTFVKNSMDDGMKPIKVLTSEIVFLDSIKTYLWPYVGSTPTDIETNESWPDADDTQIRIERDPNALVSIENIRSKAISIFTDYFSYANNTLGQVVDASELYNSLLALNGVTKVQTVKDDVEIDGISLAKWTNTIINGADFVTFTGASKLKAFQFPVFYDIDSIIDKLEIVDSNHSSGGVEY